MTQNVHRNKKRDELNSLPSRRNMLLTATFGGVGIATSISGKPVHANQESAAARTTPDDVPGPDYRIEVGKVKQSVMAWCYKPMEMERLIEACGKMGLHAMEGLSPQFYPLVKKHGMKISLIGSHGFGRGPVNPENHAFCLKKLKEGVDLAVKWKCSSVITFTGMREAGIEDPQAVENCIACWKQACRYAEDHGINLVLEMLNSRDDSHPMKGHPGYFGDDIDRCAAMIKAVESPSMKLLFDIYHVQIMNGDPIRRFRQHRDIIGHVHTAGNPGRGELDQSQELNYRPIIQAIVDSGYDGFVAQEFIPTWKDPLASLRHGVQVCDV